MSSKNDSKRRDPIKHVICLMLENRSMDQLFWDHPKIRALREAGVIHTNKDRNGKVFEQRPVPKDYTFTTQDVAHDYDSATLQMEADNGGFIRSLERADDVMENKDNCTSDRRKQEVMYYFPYKSLSVLHRLADQFVLCDRYFSSTGACTWTNRYMAMAGTSNGIRVMPQDITESVPVQEYFLGSPTIFRALSNKDVPWKVYFHDFPLSLLCQDSWKPEYFAKHQVMDRFWEDVRGKEEDFPAFSWIEPKYSGEYATDSHTPHFVSNAETLIAEVYNALIKNKALWESTLFIINWDEQGGYFDHVVPPQATYPDHISKSHPQFGCYGFRVPCLLISPWLKSGVDSTVYDHTSVLAYMVRKFNLDPNLLGARTAAANDFRHLFESSDSLMTPRRDLRLCIVPPIRASPSGSQDALSDKSTQMLGHIINAMTGTDRALLSTTEHIIAFFHGLLGGNANGDRMHKIGRALVSVSVFLMICGFLLFLVYLYFRLSGRRSSDQPKEIDQVD